MNRLTTSFQKEDLPEMILLEGLIDICQSTKTTPNNDVVKIAMLWTPRKELV